MSETRLAQVIFLGAMAVTPIAFIVIGFILDCVRVGLSYVARKIADILVAVGYTAVYILSALWRRFMDSPFWELPPVEAFLDKVLEAIDASVRRQEQRAEHERFMRELRRKQKEER